MSCHVHTYIHWFLTVCSQLLIDVTPLYVEIPPDVVIQNHNHNISAKLHEMIEIQCFIRNIERNGKIEWKFNGASIMPCTNCNVHITMSNYDDENCGYVSTILIKKFTVENQGIYTCNASQFNTKYYSSDSIHIFTSTDIVILTSVGTYVCMYVSSYVLCMYVANN